MADGVRARARAATMAQILVSGRRQLADGGAADLSVRAIARDLGMVSSAIYRYVASRDDLLTVLIVDSYDRLGETVEKAASGRGAPGRRFLRVANAMREWAIANPHEWALLFGTPVPGYQAPQETIPSGVRVPATIVGLAAVQHSSGGLRSVLPVPPISRRLAAQSALVRDALEVDLPDDAILRCLAAWGMVNGVISFELFGQLANTYEPGDDALRHTFATAALLIGFPDVV